MKGRRREREEREREESERRERKKVLHPLQKITASVNASDIHSVFRTLKTKEANLGLSRGKTDDKI